LRGDLWPTLRGDREWADRLTVDDRRALSPLFWTHVNPYGKFSLDMDNRLDLGPELTVLSGDLELRATGAVPR
jgi:hypothetical protein